MGTFPSRYNMSAVVVQQETASLGINAVRPVVQFLARTINNVVVIDGNQDGSIKGAEILNFAQKVGVDAFTTFTGLSISQVRDQFRDIDPVERGILVNDFAEYFDIPNDEAELLIEDWLLYLHQGANLIRRTRNAFSKEE